MGVSKRPLAAGEVCEDQRLREGMLPAHQEVIKVGEAEVKAEAKVEKVDKKSAKKEEAAELAIEAPAEEVAE